MPKLAIDEQISSRVQEGVNQLDDNFAKIMKKNAGQAHLNSIQRVTTILNDERDPPFYLKKICCNWLLAHPVVHDFLASLLNFEMQRSKN